MASYNPSEVLRTRSSSICSKLCNSEESLLLFAGKLFEKSIIDMPTKSEVRRTKGYEGADILMDYVITKLKDSPILIDTVLACMKEVEILTNIALEVEAKMKPHIEEDTDSQNFVPIRGMYKMLLAGT